MSERSEALAAGRKTYPSAKRCPRGHISWRRTSNCECNQCHNMRKRKSVRHRDSYRAQKATARGHAPPPPESECSAYPPDGRCQYCGSDLGALCLDHDHKTGKFRAWLCHPCNRSDVLG